MIKDAHNNLLRRALFDEWILLFDKNSLAKRCLATAVLVWSA